MRLLVVRHAIAEERAAFAATGRDDSLRPLTDDGRRKMRRGAGALHRLVPTIDLLASSPFTRAAETAEIVRAEYEMAGIQTIDVLEPDRPVAAVVGWVAARRASVVAVVGHEPQLGRLATYVLGGGDRTAVVLKKGGACLLEFHDEPRAGGARLVWSIPPSVLRDLAGQPTGDRSTG